MAVCTWNAGANGNWNVAGNWDTGTVPGDGDEAVIDTAYTVTINADIGTTGNGIKWIKLNHASAVLSFDAAASRTVYFASTGTDPVGDGTAGTPGATSTMFGFIVAKGYLDLEGTSTNKLTVTTGDDTNPCYIKHYWGDLGSYTYAKLKLRYCNLNHLGTNTAQFRGIVWYGADSTYICDIQYCTIDDPYHCLELWKDNSSGAIFSNNTITNFRSDLVKTPNIHDTLTVENNTVSSPAASAYLVLGTYSGNNWQINGNTITGDATYGVGCVSLAGTTAKTGIEVKNNHCENVSTNTTKGLITIAGYVDVLVSGNTGIYGVTDLYMSHADATGTFERNFIRASSAIAASHSNVRGSKTAGLTIRNNIIVLDSAGTLQMGMFFWDTSAGGAKTDIDSLKIYYNTIINNGAAASTSGIRIGQGGDPVGNVRVIGNIVCGFGTGIHDGDDTTNANAFEIIGAETAGVHHNLTYNCTANYGDNSGTNFDDGTNQHPHSTYGDRTGDPKFDNSGGTDAVDYKITSGSDAADMGEADYAPADDYWGTARPLGSADDIGAHEMVAGGGEMSMQKWWGPAL